MSHELLSGDISSETSATLAAATDVAVKHMVRRRFLQSGAAVAGVALASSLGSNESQAAPTGPRQQLALVRRHENDHVAFLVSALNTVGQQMGMNVTRPKPTFQNLVQPNLNAFLTTSLALENTGVGAYLGAAPAIFNRTYLAAAGQIALVEARHAGFFNGLRSLPMTNNVFGQELSFERALTVSEVTAAAGPFIQSLNDPMNQFPLTFSSTPSASNDLAILNFALALEYLEADFYVANVMKFYGV